MRSLKIISASIIFALVVGVAFIASDEASAQSKSDVTAADRTTILRVMKMTADAKGQVMNECQEKVSPKFLPAQMGGDVGTAILFVMEGGPNMATCYGDGPDLHLMKREGSGFREIYSARGRMLIILPGTTKGVHDIADGGPGFSFPLWQWNGKEYAAANRAVSDAESSRNSTYLP